MQNRSTRGNQGKSDSSSLEARHLPALTDATTTIDREIVGPGRIGSPEVRDRGQCLTRLVNGPRGESSRGGTPPAITLAGVDRAEHQPLITLAQRLIVGVAAIGFYLTVQVVALIAVAHWMGFGMP